MGKHSNIILVNSTNTIIDSLRHLSTEENSTRDILPARPYIIPQNSKKDFTTIKTFDEFYQLICNKSYLDSGISSTFIGISKLLIQYIIEINKITNEVTSPNLKTIYTELKNLISKINTTETSITSYKNDYTISEKSSENALQCNFYIDDFYSTQEENQLFTSYRNNVLKLVLTTLTKIKKKLININQKTEECKNMDTYKLYGELITANLYKYQTFSENTISLNNYYNNNELTIIPVDKNKTPSYNAKTYFKKYNKLKNALNIVNEQKKETETELSYIESIIYEIETSQTLQDIDEIYSEISENSLFEKVRTNSNAQTTKQKNKSKKVDKKYNPIEYKIEEFTLLVGKNNIQNDYLTTKLAKPNDIWFHTKDIHGSHAILLTNGSTPSIDILIRCSQIAAYYSKAKLSSNVPVDYTYIKYVKKPSGSKPGFVIYTHNKTLNVTPKN